MKNEVKLHGCVASACTFSHDTYDEKFYKIQLDIQRESGTVDKIPIIVSEKIMNISHDYTGEYMYIEGEIRSYNLPDGDKKHLVLSVFAHMAYVTDFVEHTNQVYLEGIICNHPTYRETPLKRKISDVMLAVNRLYGKSDYIPCIVWGRNANVAYNLGQGGYIAIQGRFQSREYTKVIEDVAEVKTAYEVSVIRLEVP